MAHKKTQKLNGALSLSPFCLGGLALVMALVGSGCGMPLEQHQRIVDDLNRQINVEREARREVAGRVATLPSFVDSAQTAVGNAQQQLIGLHQALNAIGGIAPVTGASILPAPTSGAIPTAPAAPVVPTPTPTSGQ